MSNLLNDSHSYYLYEEARAMIENESQLTIVKAYGLIPFKDGDQWCVLLGENLQTGIVGFGKNPANAIYNFNLAWYNN